MPHARVPFFFKQWGGTRKKKAGRELEGRTCDAMSAPPTAMALLAFFLGKCGYCPS